MFRRSRILLTESNNFFPIFVFGSSQGVALISGFIRIPLVISALGVQKYGITMIAMQVINVATLLTGGARLAVRGHLSESSEQDREQEFKTHASQSLLFGSVIFVLGLFLIVCNSAFQIINIKSLKPFDSLIIQLVILIYSSSSLLLGVAIGYCDTLRLYNKIVAFDVVSSVLSIPAVLVLQLLNAPLSFYFIVFSATYFFPGLFAIYLASRKNAFFYPRFGNMSLKWIRSILISAGQGLGMLMSSGFDLLIYTGVSGTNNAAAYSITSKLTGSISIPSAALAPAQWSAFGALRKNLSEHHLVWKIFARATSINLAYSTLIFSALAPFSSWVFPILSKHKLQFSPSLFFAMCFAQFVLTIYSTLFAAFSGKKGKLRAWHISMIVGSVNLLLTLIFTLAFGILGPSCASIVSFSLGIFLFAVVRSDVLL